MTSKSFENEFIEIYDFNGQKTGEKALKSVVHKNGLHHSTVHLWIYTISGEVLIQKRSLNKILNPCPLLTLHKLLFDNKPTNEQTHKPKTQN